jgi:hypothetical protein
MKNPGQAFWAVLIVLNTVFILNNVVIEQYGFAAINFVAALCCWAGYFRSSSQQENNEKE